jgi:predicted small metal-binding protein
MLKNGVKDARFNPGAYGILAGKSGAPGTASEGTSMEKFLLCRDVIPECTFVIRGVSANEVVMRAALHAKSEHGIGWMPPEMLRSILAAIREEEQTAISEG